MFKKSLSAVLALIMIFSLAVPAFGTYEEYPTIYVTGAQTNKIYNTNGEWVSDFDIDLGAVLEEHGTNLVTEFLIGMLSDDYEKWASDFHDIFVGIYEKSALDKNGEASNGTHPEYQIGRAHV